MTWFPPNFLPFRDIFALEEPSVSTYSRNTCGMATEGEEIKLTNSFIIPARFQRARCKRLTFPIPGVRSPVGPGRGIVTFTRLPARRENSIDLERVHKSKPPVSPHWIRFYRIFRLRSSCPPIYPHILRHLSARPRSPPASSTPPLWGACPVGA